jgi:hypothetical protein
MMNHSFGTNTVVLSISFEIHEKSLTSVFFDVPSLSSFGVKGYSQVMKSGTFHFFPCFGTI